MSISHAVNSIGNMARVKALLAGFYVLMFFVPLNAQTDHGDIEVIVTGFRSSSGTAGYALFRTEKGFPMKGELADAGGFTDIIHSSCSISFMGVPYGKYAVSVFHDENANQRLDLNVLGVPKEGVGVSNNAKGRFGPPKYKDSGFIVGSTTTRLLININYRGR